jgi:hypothetical protein
MRKTLLAFILPLAALAQVRVPFVGCPSDGQAGPVEAPKGAEQTVRIEAGAAQKLAYYTDNGPPVLAPRGWYCFGTYGSSGGTLYVSPNPIQRDDIFSPRSDGFKGPVVEIDATSGNGSGTALVAEVWARIFPAYWPIVKGLIKNGDLQAADYTFGPYPDDKLIAKTARFVQFQTRPRSEGLGTMSRLKANDDPIDGVAMLQGKNPDLLMLRVRLPDELRDLSPAIIQDLLARQRHDAR